MPARTRRQQEVLDAIHQHLETNGYRPSYQQIATSLKLRSRAGIARMVGELEDQGLLERRRESGHFTIEVTRTGFSPVEWLSSGPSSDGEIPLVLPAFITGDYAPHTLRLFRVNDEGMSPEIKEDDVAIIELRDYCRDGQTILAKLLGGELTLRKYSRTGSETTLRPINEDFQPIHTPTNRLQIIGIHRGLIRPAV